jgi:hypothetical protein
MECAWICAAPRSATSSVSSHALTRVAPLRLTFAYQRPWPPPASSSRSAADRCRTNSSGSLNASLVAMTHAPCTACGTSLGRTSWLYGGDPRALA